MPSELYEVLAQGARYWFLFLMALIVWRSYRWYRRDRRQTRKRLKLLPDAGYVGELVVTREAGSLHVGDVIAVPREGTLGALRTNDVCIPVPGVARRHLWFRYDHGKGLMVEPIRGERFSVDGEPVNPKRAPHLAHGSRLTVGEAELRLRMFAGFENVTAPRAAVRASAARMPDEPPTPDAAPDAAAQSAALYQWMMQQYAQQQAAQGGYIPQGGYAVQGGYTPQAGYTSASGYPSQGSYLSQEEYAPQAGYASASGYPSQGSYPPQEGYTPQAGYASASGYPSQGGYLSQEEYAQQAGYTSASGYPSQGSYLSQEEYAPQTALPPDAPNLDTLTPEEALAYATQLPPAQAEQFADTYATHYAAQSIADPTRPRAHAPFMRPANQPAPEWLRAMREPDSTAPTEPQAGASVHPSHADESAAPDTSEACDAPAAYQTPETDEAADASFYDAAYAPSDYDEDMTDAAAPPRSAYIGHDESERAKRRVWDKYFGGHT